jgi:hypothetical protein
MFRRMTRERWAGMWFAAVAVPVVGSIALGADVSVGAGALLLLASLMPPLIILCARPSVILGEVAGVSGPDKHRPY